METTGKASSSRKTPYPSDAQQTPLTVNPKYPLPSPLPPPQRMDRLPFPEAAQGNGVSRTTTRRRRVSGKGQLESNSKATSPEAPKAPPVSYRDPYGNVLTKTPPSSDSTSFAARVRAAPTDLISAHISGDDFDPLIQSTISNRRGSLNRPPGALYAAVQSSNRASYPSPTTDPSSPPYSSNATTPKQTQADSKYSPKISSDKRTSKGQEDAVHSASRSTTRRVSAGVVNRSPLQDLEVKLNDISKGEKRARVEEAEQLLRESKSATGTRRSSHDIEITSNSKQFGSASSGTDGKSKSVTSEEARQIQELAIVTRGQDVSSNSRANLKPAEARSSSLSDKQRSSSKRDPDPQISAIKASTTSELPLSYDRIRKPSKRRLELPESGQQPGRRVDFQSCATELDPDLEVTIDKSVQPSRTKVGGAVFMSFTDGASPSSQPDRSAMGIKVSKPIFRQQQQQTQSNSLPPVDRGPVESLPNNADHRANDDLYRSTPQLSIGGMELDKRTGISNIPNGFSDEPVRSKHHISTTFHRSRHHEPTLQGGSALNSNHLDELRQGESAHLIAADGAPQKDSGVKQSAWWEGRGSSGVNLAAHAKVRNRRDVQSLDGGYDDLYGKTFSSPSPQNRAMEFPGESSYSVNAAHVRRYIANEMLQVGQERDKSRLWRQAILLRRENPQFSLSTAYSYSCPHLDEHDGSHLYHICKPYMSKELIKSMRAIRIRTAPPSASFNPPLYLKCGPLLRYTGLKRETPPTGSNSKSSTERETWRGSVMIVTVDAESSYNPTPVLRLFPEPIDLLPPSSHQGDNESGHSLPSEYVDPIAGLPKLSRTGKTVYVKPVEDLEVQVDLSRVEDDGGLFEETRTAAVPTSYGQPRIRPRRDLSSNSISRSSGRQERDNTVRYQKTKGVKLHAERGVTFWRFNLEIELAERQVRIAYRINNGASVGFWVPAQGQTMNVMFHSCNGFSMNINPDHLSGPDPLWRDVLNSHQTRPFHVMIGGGDQIYNDAVMSQTTLFHEWLGKNPLYKHEAQFTTQMQDELETFYLERYSMWFSQGLFGMANSQIPMVNMWDDHDIIDGFGSYPDHFMRSSVFCGVGTVAFKYYMLFQHQSVVDEGPGDEPSWLLGAAPGPYIKERSRSVFVFLGKQVAFLGLDCRTERMRDEILSEESYNLAFDRCRREIIKGETKHLLILLGVPIAYPRLVWLENLLTSKAMDPIKALSRAGILGSFFNRFDRGVEILDDLDDHWTSKNHKAERNWFIQELQEIAAEKSVRVTILGGDVHMAAVGQFFSNPRLKISKDRDHRYMANIISSAIVNAPPPEMMSDIINKRNKIHHLDLKTDENMIPIFTHDIDGKPRSNKHLLPRRNWCSIREYRPGTTPPSTAPSSEPRTPNDVPPRPENRLQRTLSLTRNDVKPGNLFRRLSQRSPGPSLEYPPSNQYRSSSPINTSPPFHSLTNDDYFTPRQRSVVQQSSGDCNPTSLSRHSSAPLPRPGNFHRRPTNMSEKVTRKGDSDETNGHINLEQGLDIVLNCEANQRDPAGTTIPYRLLIPMLWYEGDCDRNQAAYRKKSWISRLGSISKGSSKRSDLAKGQGGGEWGGSYSEDSGSYSDSVNETITSSKVRFAQRSEPFGVANATERGLAKGGESDAEKYPMRKVEHRSVPGNDGFENTQAATTTPSKLDHMLGMAGPIRGVKASDDGRIGNGKVTAHGRGDGNGNGSRANARGTASRCEQNEERNLAGAEGLEIRATGRGYNGIEAYKESRWRRFF